MQWRHALLALFLLPSSSFSAASPLLFAASFFSCCPPALLPLNLLSFLVFAFPRTPPFEAGVDAKAAQTADLEV